jgi:hypothetical protein
MGLEDEVLSLRQSLIGMVHDNQKLREDLAAAERRVAEIQAAMDALRTRRNPSLSYPSYQRMDPIIPTEKPGDTQ